VVAWRRIREGMVYARPRRNSGILSLEEERKFYFCRSGYVTPCMDSSKLGVEPLMYNKSVVKTSYDKGSILK
jgi:hypothetical protein